MMKKKKRSTSAQAELKTLADYLRGAVDSLARFLGQVAGFGGQPTTPAVTQPAGRTGRRSPAGKTPATWPWDKILPVAQKLLSKEPTRRWRSGEFSRAIREAGVKLSKVTGLHFGLLPRLRDMGVISEDGKGGFTASKGERKHKGKLPAKNVSPGRRAARSQPATIRTALPRSGKSTPSSANKLLVAAKTVLDADPSKLWTRKDFIAAVRKTGVDLPTWRGVHLALPAQLREQKLIEGDGQGFRALSRTQPTPAAKTE